MIQQLDNFSRRFANWLALLGLFALVALAILTISNVMGRWLFSSPLHWVEDIYRLLIAVVVASFFPSAFAQRGHIAIEFLSAVLSPALKKLFAIVIAAVVLCYVIILGWLVCEYTYDVWSNGETTWLKGYSVTPWWAAVSVLLLLTIPVQLVVLAHTVAYGPHQGGHGSDTTDATENNNS